VTRTLGLALLLWGCGETSEPWHGDSAFTPAERETIVEAEAWAAFKAGQPSRGVVFDAPHPGPQEATCVGCISRRSEGGGYFEAVMRTEAEPLPPGRIALTPVGKTREHFFNLAAHEFLHFHVGEDHAGGDGLMAPTPPPTRVWSDDDELWLRSKH
jgi:hypothetical protein